MLYHIVRSFLLSLFLVSVSIPALADTTARVTADAVRLRSAPSLSSRIVAHASRGQEIKIKGQEGAWLQIDRPADLEVWVHSEFVSPAGQVTGDWVRMRPEPSTDNESKLGWLRQGQWVSVVRTMGDWSQIRAPGGTSVWIHQNYVELPGSTRSDGPRAQRSVVQGVPVDYVTAGQDSPDTQVTVRWASGGLGSREPLTAIINRSRPQAAITGTYFKWGDNLPIFPVVVENRVLERGFKTGSALTISPNGRYAIRRLRDQADRRDLLAQGHRIVLGAGPCLVQDGQVAFSATAAAGEGFTDPRVLGGWANRVAVGLTSDGQIMFASSGASVSPTQWASILRELGCVDAMNLDGGGSTALFVRGARNGGYLTYTDRHLTNLLVMVPKAAPVDRGLALDSLELGGELLDSGKAEAAIDHLRLSVEGLPEDAEAHKMLARASTEVGLDDTAAALYLRAGEIQEQASDLNGALQSYEQAYDVLPTRVDAYSKAVEILKKNGRFGEADQTERQGQLAQSRGALIPLAGDNAATRSLVQEKLRPLNFQEDDSKISDENLGITLSLNGWSWETDKESNTLNLSHREQPIILVLRFHTDSDNPRGQEREWAQHEDAELVNQDQIQVGGAPALRSEYKLSRYGVETIKHRILVSLGDRGMLEISGASPEGLASKLREALTGMTAGIKLHLLSSLDPTHRRASWGPALIREQAGDSKRSTQTSRPTARGDQGTKPVRQVNPTWMGSQGETKTLAGEKSR